VFNLYSEVILRHIKDMPGVSINGHDINQLRYADDIVLMAYSVSWAFLFGHVVRQESAANAKGTRDSSACMKAHCEQM